MGSEGYPAQGSENQVTLSDILNGGDCISRAIMTDCQFFDRSVALTAERRSPKPDVAGSNPA